MTEILKGAIISMAPPEESVFGEEQRAAHLVLWSSDGKRKSGPGWARVSADAAAFREREADCRLWYQEPDSNWWHPSSYGIVDGRWHHVGVGHSRRLGSRLEDRKTADLPIEEGLRWAVVLPVEGKAI